MPTSLMLGRKPCPSPAAKSNSITKARNDETTKSNPRTEAGRTPSIPFPVPFPRVRGHYESRPRFRPAFSEAERDSTQQEGTAEIEQKVTKITKGRNRSGTGRRALFSGPGDHNGDGRFCLGSEIATFCFFYLHSLRLGGFACDSSANSESRSGSHAKPPRRKELSQTICVLVPSAWLRAAYPQ